MRNFGLPAVTVVPWPIQVDETPPKRDPFARLVSSTAGRVSALPVTGCA
jgi:hypothetical protein